MAPVDVAVIGAGIIGLSSACAIQEQVPGVSVTIYADKFFRDTTSHGAGGIFVPLPLGADEETYKLWAGEGARHFFDLAFSSQSAATGVNLITGFELMNSLDNVKERCKFLDYMPFSAPMSEDLLRRVAPYYKHGFIYTTVIVDGSKYLPWLMKRFTDKGGKYVKRKIGSFQELSSQYSLVVNCSGLGSRELVGDLDLQPCRGHIVRVKAPWIKHFLHTDDGKYVLPNSETVAVGGTKQMGRSDMAAIPEETEEIYQQMRARFPALEGSKLMWDWIGLRPMRTTVRFERETRNFHGKQMQIIHNYGHSAHGISLSWGTGIHAAKVIKDILHDTRSRL